MLRILSSMMSRLWPQARVAGATRDAVRRRTEKQEAAAQAGSDGNTVHLRESMKLRAIAAIAALLYASRVSADDADAPMFTFNAFGTFGVTHSSEDQADFAPGLRNEGAGFSDEWSFAVDSLLAGQVNANFTPKLSAV